MSPKKSIISRRPSDRQKTLRPGSQTKRTTLPPLFLTIKLRKSIERLLPTGHHQRLRYYFDTHGCLRCSHNDVIYGGNGFCNLCLHMIEKRLRKVDREMQTRLCVPQPNLEEAYLRPYNSARQLLSDLVLKIDNRTAQKKAEPKHPPRIYLKWST